MSINTFIRYHLQRRTLPEEALRLFITEFRPSGGAIARFRENYWREFVTIMDTVTRREHPVYGHAPAMVDGQSYIVLGTGLLRWGAHALLTGVVHRDHAPRTGDPDRRAERLLRAHPAAKWAVIMIRGGTTLRAAKREALCIP